MRGAWRALALTFAALALEACASAPPPKLQVASAPSRPGVATEARPASPPPAQSFEPPLRFVDLPGWEQEDHAAALDAFRDGCGVARDAAWREVCLRARDLGPQDDVISRAFLETNFSLQPVADEGLLTGYFAPEYPARKVRGGAFTAPRVSPSSN